MTTLEHPPPTDRTYYLSGPISGNVEQNEARFAQACLDLRARGYRVMSPVEICNEHLDLLDLQKDKQAWDWFMRRCIEAMMHDSVTGIIMLPGWEHSQGAKVELQLAQALRWRITTLGECLIRPAMVTL